MPGNNSIWNAHSIFFLLKGVLYVYMGALSRGDGQLTKSPPGTSVQYCGGYSVRWKVFSTVGDIISTVGNIISIVGDNISTLGGYHQYC